MRRGAKRPRRITIRPFEFRDRSPVTPVDGRPLDKRRLNGIHGGRSNVTSILDHVQIELRRRLDLGRNRIGHTHIRTTPIGCRLNAVGPGLEIFVRKSSKSIKSIEISDSPITPVHDHDRMMVSIVFDPQLSAEESSIERKFWTGRARRRRRHYRRGHQ